MGGITIFGCECETITFVLNDKNINVKFCVIFNFVFSYFMTLNKLIFNYLYIICCFFSNAFMLI